MTEAKMLCELTVCLSLSACWKGPLGRPRRRWDDNIKIGFGEIRCEVGRNINDSYGTSGESIRGVQSPTFTAGVALEFKASLGSNLGMELAVLLLADSNELNCAEGMAVRVDWSFD